jgi:adenylate cyclase
VSATAEQTFLFADLSGFTALTEAHGDEEAADVGAGFIRAVLRLLEDVSAELVKTIGDEVMVRCADAGEAVRLGLRIVEEVGGQHGFPVVRVGMHTGPAAERDGDWFGATVNLAARISAIAGGDEVILSDATRQAAGAVDGVTLRERGRQTLRNVGEPVLLFQAERLGRRTVVGLPIDPVCRMAVDPQDASGSLRHAGVRYYFCSLECAQKFAGDPERYAVNVARLTRSGSTTELGGP